MVGALKQIWANPYVRVLVGLLVAVLIYLLLVRTQSVWASFLIAYLIAYLLNPLVSWFERRDFHRSFGVFIVVLLLLASLGLLWLLGVQLAAQLTVFTGELPTLISTVEELPYLISRQIDPSFGALFQQVFVTLQRLAQGIATQVLPSLESAGAGGGVLAWVSTVGGGGFQAFIVFVLTLYLLYNYPHYSRSFLRAFPHRYRPGVEEIMGGVSFAVGGYIRGQLLIAVMVGVLTGLGLFLLGIPLAIGLGVVAGVANLIPFFGPVIAAIPTALFAFTAGFGSVLGALGVLILVQQIDANILTPLVYSQTIEIDPVTIIVAILAGSALFGVVGAILSVPVAAFLTLLYRDYYVSSRWYRSEREPSAAD